MDLYLVQNVETAARVIEGQAVVITPGDAELHTLNEVGTFIWSRADGRRQVQAILADVADAFDVAPGVAAADGQQFIEICVRKGLLHTSLRPEPVDLSGVLGDEPLS